jgi:hypothetical protein
MVERRGTGVLLGTYTWFYRQPFSCTFEAAFVDRLNVTAWVPDRNGSLQPPALVVFDETGWKANPSLLSKIHFKPPIIETLARAAGIEPGLLDLIVKLGLTEAELKKRLGIKEGPQQQQGKPGAESVGDALKSLLGDLAKPTPPVPDPAGPDPVRTDGDGEGRSRDGSSGFGTYGGSGHHGAGSAGEGGRADGPGGGQHASVHGPRATRTFFSYVATHPDEERQDPDGLEHQARLALEEKAIKLIIKREPELQRTPTNNEGFDLVEPGPSGEPIRWVEVKAMTGDFRSRPVGMSRPQFNKAQEQQGRYWLYVVEHAGLPEGGRIVRIQDPAGKARTFTFDHGWLLVAEIDEPDQPDQQE